MDKLLKDAQERLVYRTNGYVEENNIRSCNPSLGDLAYPDKLEMIKGIAESLAASDSMVADSSVHEGDGGRGGER